MPGDRGPFDDAGIRRAVPAVCFLGVIVVVSYLTSPNTSHDPGTALEIGLAVLLPAAVLVALRWWAVRPRR